MDDKFRCIVQIDSHMDEAARFVFPDHIVQPFQYFGKVDFNPIYWCKNHCVACHYQSWDKSWAWLLINTRNLDTYRWMRNRDEEQLKGWAERFTSAHPLISCSFISGSFYEELAPSQARRAQQAEEFEANSSAYKRLLGNG